MAVGSLDERRYVSVLFCDISGYNTLTEKLSASELSALLNEYFEMMGEAVSKFKENHNHQILSACIGNRIIVVFGSPLPLEDHAWLAMQTANEMSERVGEYKNKLLSTNKPAIKIGIGIHSESVLSRNLSATKGMDFMAIGADVHVGYRLEGICKQYGCNIVISQKTYQLCQEKIRVRELDFIRLPGESRPVTIYEYLGLDGDSISEQKQEALKHYQKGREHYLNRKFALAMGEFAKVMELETNDKAAAIQLKRCQHWLKTPPPEDKEWDGCWPGN